MIPSVKVEFYAVFVVGIPGHDGKPNIEFHRPNANIHADAEANTDLETSVCCIEGRGGPIDHHALGGVVGLGLEIEYIFIYKTAIAEDRPAHPIFQNGEWGGHFHLRDLSDPTGSRDLDL